MGGDNVGLNIKGLDKQNMLRVGDVMIYKKDSTLDRCGQFTAQIQTLDIPGEIKLGYSHVSPSLTATLPSCSARSRSSCTRRTCRPTSRPRRRSKRSLCLNGESFAHCAAATVTP